MDVCVGRPGRVLDRPSKMVGGLSLEVSIWPLAVGSVVFTKSSRCGWLERYERGWNGESVRMDA